MDNVQLVKGVDEQLDNRDTLSNLLEYTRHNIEQCVARKREDKR